MRRRRGEGSPAAWTVLIVAVVVALPTSRAAAQVDVADVPSKRCRVNRDRHLRYVLIGADESRPAPPDGYGVLVVLPGGDGDAGFTSFVKRIYRHVLNEDYLVVQLIAPKWRRGQRIIWPKECDRVRGKTTSVERFATAAVADVGKLMKLNPRRIFLLAWSSGGPAGYAISMTSDTPVTGTIAAMSVFVPEQLPPLAGAEGHAYYVLHSPQDDRCPYWMAEQAQRDLERHGATVQFVAYEGGHRWGRDVFGKLRGGVEWLESQTLD